MYMYIILHTHQNTVLVFHSTLERGAEKAYAADDMHEAELTLRGPSDAWHAAPQVSVFVLLYFCTSKASKRPLSTQSDASFVWALHRTRYLMMRQACD